MKTNEEIINKIKELIDKFRPYLNMDGGDIEFIKYEDGYLYIRLYGACEGCLSQESTLDDNLLPVFQNEVPEIKGIINISI